MLIHFFTLPYNQKVMKVDSFFSVIFLYQSDSDRIVDCFGCTLSSFIFVDCIHNRLFFLAKFVKWSVVHVKKNKLNCHSI